MVSAATTAPISSPICCHIGVAPTIKPVLRSCDVSPAIAATIQITVPTQIADTIPVYPVIPVPFNSAVAISRVAIAIPETGLLEDPTSPTIRLDTVAKKNPKMITSIAPNKRTGTDGRSQITTAISNTPARTAPIGSSLEVRRASCRCTPMHLTALVKVSRITGNVLIRLIIPPAATAPAPIYRI